MLSDGAFGREGRKSAVTGLVLLELGRVLSAVVTRIGAQALPEAKRFLVWEVLNKKH